MTRHTFGMESMETNRHVRLTQFIEQRCGDHEVTHTRRPRTRSLLFRVTAARHREVSRDHKDKLKRCTWLLAEGDDDEEGSARIARRRIAAPEQT